MDAEEIAKRAAAAQAGKQNKAQLEDEKAQLQIDRAQATGTRITIIKDEDGEELNVQPMGFFAALNGLERENLFLIIPLCVPMVILVAIALIIAKRHGVLTMGIAAASVAVAYLTAVFLITRWYLGSVPLIVRVTPKGHVALWHRSYNPQKPFWVGPRESFKVRLGTFGRRNPKTGDWERRHGWTEIDFWIPDSPLRYSGPAYFLNNDDAATAKDFLKKHKILY
ncbi:hypothetical protein KKF84_08965 [Myxococcota bacterium]|nr:hypothetical protein [Myxococcota bacterium]